MKLVRIWFKKQGAARYISHLDLNRCVSRAFHRAKIPLWYTQGFNPHAFLTFALPLSLGLSGERESMDIKLESEMPKAELIERLNSALPDDIAVYDVTEPVMKPGQIAFAAFTIALEPEDISPQELAERIRDLSRREEILVEKRSKSGMKEVDVKPYLSGLGISVSDGKVQLSALLPAGSTENINPGLLLTAIERETGCRFYAETSRVNLYNAKLEAFA